MTFFERILDITRTSTLPYLCLIIVPIVYIIKLIINRKFSFIDTIALITTVIVGFTYYLGAEGATLCALGLLRGSVGVDLIFILAYLFLLCFPLIIIINIIMILRNDTRIKAILACISIMLANFLLVLSFVYEEDIMYLMEEEYGSSNSYYVANPILLRHINIYMVSLLISAIIIGLCIKKYIKPKTVSRET